MTYLLDTHYVIWLVYYSEKLSKKIRDVITDPENRIVVSAVSFWEISLKCSLGKLDVDGTTPEQMLEKCIIMGFEIEDLSANISSTYHHLKATYHKDPFDRMLIWKAIRNGYTLISSDSSVKKYASEGLKIIG